MKVLGFCLVIVLSILLTFLNAYCLMQVVHLYNIPIIIDWSYIQLVGLSLVMHFLLFIPTNNKENEEKTFWYEIFMGVFTKLLYVLLSWGMANLIYWFFINFIK